MLGIFKEKGTSQDELKEFLGRATDIFLRKDFDSLEAQLDDEFQMAFYTGINGELKSGKYSKREYLNITKSVLPPSASYEFYEYTLIDTFPIGGFLTYALVEVRHKKSGEAEFSTHQEQLYLAKHQGKVALRAIIVFHESWPKAIFNSSGLA